MISTSNPKLARLQAFFEKHGAERLNGLDESYFADLNDTEKAQAWDFLQDGFSLSSDCITGLYLLNKSKAVDLFKKTIDSPAPPSPYQAQRKALENNRLLMFKYINVTAPEDKYLDAMIQFSVSEFSEIRAAFALSLPTNKIKPAMIDALKSMIFTETERIPLSNAITKLMEIHGLDYDIGNPFYKAIYLALRADDSNKKISAMHKLNRHQLPDFE